MDVGVTSADADDDLFDAPYFKGFVMILPEGIPVHDEQLWSFETDELEPLLDGVPMAPTAKFKSPVPSDGVGRNFVSLRFWQVEDKSQSPFEVDIRHLMDAFERVHPNEAKGSFDGFLSDVPLTPVRHRTAVEAVTFVASNDDLVATETKPDPLTRCLEKIFEWHRAYRLTAKTPTDELTYQRLFPMVLTFRRRPFDETVTPDGIMTLNSTNIALGAMAEHIGSVDTDAVAFSMSRLRHGDPVVAYVERRGNANHELFVNGDYGASVIQLAIGCEVVIDGLLKMLLWEEGTSEADAAVVFSDSTIVARIKTQYGSRIGGSWDLTTGIIGRWYEDVAGIRNRIVHSGYRPTAAEVRTAMDAADALTRFISDRLCDKFRTFEKTTWLFLGQEGFEKRDRFSRRVKDWLTALPPNSVNDWVREYAEFRDKVNAQVQIRRITT